MVSQTGSDSEPLTSINSGRGLLIGGGGLLGSQVRGALNLKGFRYDVFARSPVPMIGHGSSDCAGSQVLRGDLDHPVQIDQAVQGHRWIVYIPTNGPSKVEHAAHIAEAAQRHNVTVILKVSAILAGADPPLSFGIEHWRAEQVLMRTSIPLIVLRPAFFMQTFQMFADLMHRKGKLLIPVPSGRTAFVDTQDVADCVATCLQRPQAYVGQAWPLTGPEALSMKEVASQFSFASGQNVEFIAPPRLIARIMMRFGERMDSWLVKRLMQMFSALQANRESAISPHVETILGRPATRFEAFLQRDPAARCLWQDGS